MTDPVTRPGNDDEGINNATEQVVETWRDATDGKDPSADEGDFTRMRDAFAKAASREEQLDFADGEAGDARNDTAQTRAGSSGPDA